MKLALNPELAKAYKSPSQQIRVMTEEWVGKNAFCPRCGSPQLTKFPNNAPTADFFCPTCGEEFELKSSKVRRPRKITDGAFDTMIERLHSNNNPSFFFLGYNRNNLSVQNFFVVPKYFFVPSLIEPRNPLPPSARRAGWVGCNILMHAIPSWGKIFIIKEACPLPRASVLSRWKQTSFLKDQKSLTAKGWTLDVMKCIESLRKPSFTIEEMYGFEDILRMSHPENRHIKAKIRQQLQILRDRGIIRFSGRGKYELTVENNP